MHKLIVQIVVILLEDSSQLDTQPGSQCSFGHMFQ